MCEVVPESRTHVSCGVPVTDMLLRGATTPDRSQLEGTGVDDMYEGVATVL